MRPLAEVAVENAAEGCAGETWGALLAMHQAATARDPEVRAAMADVARDESRHAALAWAAHRWALGTLDEAACGRVERAADDAWDALERAISADPPVRNRSQGSWCHAFLLPRAEAHGSKNDGCVGAP